LRLVVADSCAPLVEPAVAAYEEYRPWVRTTSVILNTAMAESVLRDGGADLALLAGPEVNRGEGDLWREGFARDGVAVIAHPTLPLSETGLTQLREIFRGRLQEWDGTVFTVVSREDGSGTRALFESIALGGQDTTLNAVVVPSGEAMVEYVSSTPGSIGYVSTLHLSSRLPGPSGDVRSQADTVRILPLEGLLPTDQAIGDGSYLLWRQLYLASPGDPRGEAREFAQWALRGGLGSIGGE
jgi:phosphate transport system substrate-binding protein